jgi:putative hydrolase
MSTPFGAGNPLERLFGDLLRSLGSSGPLQWDLARQAAQLVASGGEPEANVDPLQRIGLEDLWRVAELHVGALAFVPPPERPVAVRPVGRVSWALEALDAWRQLLEVLAAALARGLRHDETEGAGEDEPARAAWQERDEASPRGTLGGLLGSLGQVMAPALLGLQIGAAVGYLARRSLGQYDLPIPRPGSEAILVVPANLEGFARDWSLSLEEVSLVVLACEHARHSVLSRPHVADRFLALLRAHADGFRPDPAALEERLSGLDPGDPSALEAVLGDPQSLLGTMRTPEQEALGRELAALVAALEGFADRVGAVIAERLLGGGSRLEEAFRRRRVEREETERFVERLLGVDVGQATVERGRAFVDGVIERAGEEGLLDLWRSAATLPTPAEVDAPGLWLERIRLEGAAG